MTDGLCDISMTWPWWVPGLARPSTPEELRSAGETCPCPVTPWLRPCSGRVGWVLTLGHAPWENTSVIVTPRHVEQFLPSLDVPFLLF